MSAYIVEKELVLFLAQAASEYQIKWINGNGEWQNITKTASQSQTNALAQRLWDENIRSVNYRYQETNNPKEFIIKKIEHQGTYDIDPIQVLKSIHCLQYQSCETSDWEKTEEYIILKALEQAAIRHLPRYEQAEWGAPKDTPHYFKLSLIK